MPDLARGSEPGAVPSALVTQTEHDRLAGGPTPIGGVSGAASSAEADRQTEKRACCRRAAEAAISSAWLDGRRSFGLSGIPIVSASRDGRRSRGSKPGAIWSTSASYGVAADEGAPDDPDDAAPKLATAEVMEAPLFRSQSEGAERRRCLSRSFTATSKSTVAPNALARFFLNESSTSSDGVRRWLE